MIKTKEEFGEIVKEVRRENHDPIGFGIARVSLGIKDPNKVLQASYPVVNWGEENLGSAAIFRHVLDTLADQDASNENNEDAVSDSRECAEVIHDTENEMVVRVSDRFVHEALACFAPFASEAVGNAHKNVQTIRTLADVAEKIKVGVSQQDQEYLGLSNYHEFTYDLTFVFKDAPVETVQAGYLKLYALSLGKAPLRSLNLDGLFGKLTNCAWVGNEPIELDYLRDNEIELKFAGQYPNIDYVDKFPAFLMHVIPDENTRILDAKKVRMGAQLAAGTTVMPGASYINFNAGTLGPVMVEGRISSSAIVGANSDIGGGASILGVLSGTDGDPISIGEKCLLGANSVCGIPLGNSSIIDAGLAVLPGTKVSVTADELAEIIEVNPDSDKEVLFNNTMFKAKDLSGMNGMHFRQDSQTGNLLVKRSTREVKLNNELH